MTSVNWIFVLVAVFFSCAFGEANYRMEHSCRFGFVPDTYVICKNVIQQSMLNDFFFYMSNEEAKRLILTDHSKVHHIPVKSIEKNGVKSISIQNSALWQLFERDPSIVNELTYLSLEKVTLRNGLIASQMNALQELETLVVKDTEIPVIEREFSENLSKKIKSVSFTNTKTQSIDRAFVGKLELEDVRIHNAALTTLKRGDFPFPSNHLRQLSFDGNQIETLPDDLFYLMGQLHRLSLANNKISQVSESVFGEVLEKLNYLNLDGNPIKCDCSIKWLTTRDLQNIDLRGKCVLPQSLAGSSLKELRQSDLSDCE